MSEAEKSPEWALDNVRFDSDAGDNLTCRQYLCALLAQLWSEGSGFSGKRPFGNSGWECDIENALSEAGSVSTADFVHRMIAALAVQPTTGDKHE